MSVISIHQRETWNMACDMWRHVRKQEESMEEVHVKYSKYESRTDMKQHEEAESEILKGDWMRMFLQRMFQRKSMRKEGILTRGDSNTDV